MSNNYGEFEGTELDPSLDIDFEEEKDDLLPILGLSALVAAIVGAILVTIGKKRNPTPQERIEEAVERVGKKGKTGAKSVSNVVDVSKLGNLLDEATSKVRERGGAIDLGSMLDDALSSARNAADRLPRAQVTAGIDDALEAVRKASERVDTSAVTGGGKQALKKAASTVNASVDSDAARNLVDTLKTQLSDMIESLRADIAPKAAETLKDDVLPAVQGAASAVTARVKDDVIPAARDAVDKLRDDVIPTAQERVEKAADDYQVGPRMRSATQSARTGAVSLSHVLRSVGLAVFERVVKDILPEVSEKGGRAVSRAREDFAPSAAQAAGGLVDMAREVKKVRGAGPDAQVPEAVGNSLEEARKRLDAAMRKAETSAAVGAGGGRKRSRNGTSPHHGVDAKTGPIASAKQSVGTAVNATTTATRQLTGVLMWLSLLTGLLLIVFVPDRDKQREIYENVAQLIGELREMWSDLQGTDFEVESAIRERIQ